MKTMLLFLMTFGNCFVALVFVEILLYCINSLNPSFYTLGKGVGVGIYVNTAFCANTAIMLLFTFICFFVYKKMGSDSLKKMWIFLLIMTFLMLGCFILHCIIFTRFKLYFFLLDFMLMFLTYISIYCLSLNNYKQYAYVGFISIFGLIMFIAEINICYFLLTIL